MSEKDHDYKAGAKIKLYLSIGLTGCEYEDESTIEEISDLTQGDLDSMSKKDVDDAMEKAVIEWSYNYIERSWSVED